MSLSPEAVLFFKTNKGNQGESRNFVIASRITWMDSNLPFRGTPWVPPVMAPTGRIRPKGILFFRFQVDERVGISLVIQKRFLG